MPPMSIDDFGGKRFDKLLIEIRDMQAEKNAWAAYPEEMKESVNEEMDPDDQQQAGFFDEIREDAGTRNNGGASVTWSCLR